MIFVWKVVVSAILSHFESFCSRNTEIGCDNTSGECVEGCKDGRYGDACDQQCNPLCTSCSRSDGACITCVPGRYGNTCTQFCSTYCKETVVAENNMIFCEKLDGACREGACKPNWWGRACDRPCGQNCAVDGSGNRICGFLEGACANGCDATYYGPACDRTCSDRCENRLCVDFEDNCIQGCAEGYYGPTCSGTCSRHCAGAGKCTRDIGRCFEGCEGTYYGTTCNGICSDRCENRQCVDFEDNCILGCAEGYYGPTCSVTCSRHCALAGKCMRDTGRCLEGCELNYYGDRCDRECINACLNGTCASDGVCEDCKSSPIGPQCRVQASNSNSITIIAVSSSLSAVIVILLVTGTLYIVRTKKLCKKESNAENTYDSLQGDLRSMRSEYTMPVQYRSEEQNHAYINTEFC